MYVKFCNRINKTLEVIQTLVMTVFLWVSLYFSKIKSKRMKLVAWNNMF